MQIPKILIKGKFVFTTFPADVFEDRKHIHIISKKGRRQKIAKIWIEKKGNPDIEISKQGGFSDVEINKIIELIRENRPIIEKQLAAFKKGEKVKIIKLI